MYGAQPALRSGEKGERRHGDEPESVIETSEPRADQSHVVVERQPAHEHVGGIDLERAAHRVQVGEHVRVRQDHAFGVTRAPRGVLEKRNVVRSGCRSNRLCGAADDFSWSHDIGQTGNLRAQEQSQGFCLRHGDEDARLCIRKYARVPAHVILDLRGTRGRIDRHRYAAGKQDAQKAVEVVGAGREHDGNRCPRRQVALEQAGCDARRAIMQCGIGHVFRYTAFARQRDVDAVWVRLQMPVERLDDRARMLGCRRADWRDCARFCECCVCCFGRACAEHGVQQVARRFGIHQRPFGQIHAKASFDAQD